MLFNSEVNFGELINISSGGMSVKTYPQIVDMLKTRYKEIYGSDINLDPATADGIWIQNIALLINNILQANQMLYTNLDVDSASGVYLENLCKLSNVYRKNATSSQVRVRITNLGNAQVTLNQIDCIDINGITWSWIPSSLYTMQQIILDPNENIELVLSCSQTGSINAPIGTIMQVVNLPQSNILLSVEQLEDAIVGNDTETDAELKARRNDSSSPIGITTLGSLVGALLNIAGIRDCVIINNTTGANWTSGANYKGFDNTIIDGHSIYIILRYNGIVDEQNVGDTIYQKLTPGISTAKAGSEDLTDLVDGWADPVAGELRTVKSYPSELAQIDDQFKVDIYWKMAKPIQPRIDIVLDEYSYFNPSEINSVGPQMMEYLNSLQLNTNLNKTDLKMKMIELDPQFKGKATYAINSVAIAGVSAGSEENNNQLTYYNYTNYTYDTETHTLILS